MNKFISKSAAAGLSAESEALDNMMERIYTSAPIGSAIGSAIVGSGAGALGGATAAAAGNALLGLGGHAIGSIAGAGDADTKKKLNKFSYWSLIPGVSAYRSARRDAILDKELSKGRVEGSVSFSERIGRLSTVLAMAAIGAGVGHYGIKAVTGDTDKDAALTGGLIGAGVGLGADLIGQLTARKTRTDKEHAEYLSRPGTILSNLTVPGLAAHNAAHRYDLMRRDYKRDK